MTFEADLRELEQSYRDSPFPSFKVTSYFRAYTELFAHLRNKKCTFIETGVLNGGSLFMWRSWLGPEARIIGIDLNPEAARWRDEGFEIHVGDQGDPKFWRECFEEIGEFDVLLDDGGHQSFQQIVTLSEAIQAARKRALIVIEDTCTSMMSEFAIHRDLNFLAFAKDSTDLLTARMSHFFPGQFPEYLNGEVMDAFRLVSSIQFFTGIVAFRLDPSALIKPELVWNRQIENNAQDYRYLGVAHSAEVNWPDPYASKRVTVRGKST
jgi:hypothetical protein